jgi:hypothetical protein
MAIDTTSPRSRRALLLGALGGIGALAAQTLGRPATVAAIDGQPLIVGVGNSTNGGTRLSINGVTSLYNVFEVSSAGSGAAITGSSSAGKGVFGSSFSAAGGHFQGSPGVAGISTTGYGGFFNGAVAQLRLQPRPTAGKPTTGLHLAGEVYMDSKGTLFICKAGGNPGTWRRVSTVAV